VSCKKRFAPPEYWLHMTQRGNDMGRADSGHGLKKNYSASTRSSQAGWA